jgi:hypothetical protein
MSKYQISLASFIATVLFTSVAFGEGKLISGAELKSLLPDSTMTGVSSKGRSWEAKFAGNGTYTVEVPEVNYSDKGTWEFKGDGYCSERTKRGNQCFTIHHVSGNDYIREDERGQGTKIQILK